MHQKNYQCKVCWNKALTFGVDSLILSFRTIVSPKTCKVVFNPNVIIFQSNCVEGLHFSAFHLTYKVAVVKNINNPSTTHQWQVGGRGLNNSSKICSSQ